MGGRRGGRALPDQRPELRPLQNVRYQGPEPEHQLGYARGRRRAELRQYVRQSLQSSSRTPQAIRDRVQDEAPVSLSQWERVGVRGYRSIREGTNPSPAPEGATSPKRRGEPAPHSSSDPGSPLRSVRDDAS